MEQEISEGMATISLIIKADTAGSLEAIQYEIGKLSRERIVPKIIIAAVGAVSEGDVKSAQATPGTIILAFHTKIDSQAGSLAERSGVPIEEYAIIYKLTERVTALLEEREPHIDVEEVFGSAKVLKVFSANKDKQVLGARVNSGTIEKGASVKIIRRDIEIGRGKVKELQQSKMAVDTVNEGNEFGSMIEAKVEIAPGDIIERVVMVTK